MNPPRLITLSDFVLILCILSLSLVSFFVIRSNNRPGDEVIIESDAGLVSISLLKGRERFGVEGRLGVSIIEISRGRVRMAESPCPSKTCIHTGWISKKGETIVCIPNHIIIKIDGKTREEYDAISR